MIRTFVGLPLPAVYQEGLGEFTRIGKKRLRSKISWTKPGNWHLTLKFIGDLDEDILPDVVSALNDIEWTGFACRAGGVGFFPPKGAPRVMWLGLKKGAKEAAVLARDVNRLLEPLGIERDKRLFAAHLTLGRIKKAEKDAWHEAAREMEKLEWPEFSADHFILWKSDLQPQGPMYTALEEYAAIEGR